MRSATFDSVCVDSAKAALDGIIESTIAPNAAGVDASGAFPRAALDALSAAGLLGLAFSEFGSRSHFWAPVSSATVQGDSVRLDARKSWVTSAGEADSFVWSSPITAEGAVVPGSARLGEDGAGLDIALGTVLPTFLVLSAAFSLGLMEAMVAEAAAHLRATRPSLAARLMAPTTDALDDFVGRAALRPALFGDA